MKPLIRLFIASILASAGCGSSALAPAEAPEVVGVGHYLVVEVAVDTIEVRRANGGALRCASGEDATRCRYARAQVEGLGALGPGGALAFGAIQRTGATTRLVLEAVHRAASPAPAMGACYRVRALEVPLPCLIDEGTTCDRYALDVLDGEAEASVDWLDFHAADPAWDPRWEQHGVEFQAALDAVLAGTGPFHACGAVLPPSAYGASFAGSQLFLP